MAAAVPAFIFAREQKKDAAEAREQQARELAALQQEQDRLTNEARNKEEAAVTQAFAKTASRRKSTSAATLPGAVARGEAIGGTGPTTAAAKKLIGE